MWRFGRLVDPYSEMSRLRNEMNRLFSGGGYPFQAVYPAVNIWMNEEGAVVTAELPGVDVKNIDISVMGDTVTISGKREAVALKEDESDHRKERNGSAFSRTLQLPFKVQVKSIDARYETGILKLCLPRLEAEKPRKIAVKGN
jgi:HSP20 family protein